MDGLLIEAGWNVSKPQGGKGERISGGFILEVGTPPDKLSPQVEALLEILKTVNGVSVGILRNAALPTNGVIIIVGQKF